MFFYFRHFLDDFPIKKFARNFLKRIFWLARQVCKPNSVLRLTSFRLRINSLKGISWASEASEWVIIYLGPALLRGSGDLLFSMRFKLVDLIGLILHPVRVWPFHFRSYPSEIAPSLHLRGGLPGFFKPQASLFAPQPRPAFAGRAAAVSRYFFIVLFF